MANYKTLVTGAAGFVGSNLLHRLKSLNYDFVGVDSLQFGYIQNVPECEFGRTDIKYLSDTYVNQFDVMVIAHCSNIIYSMAHPIETFINNSINTIDLISKFKGKIIYCSTSSTYGNADHFPTNEDAPHQLNNAYDSSKYSVDQYLKLRGNYTTLVLTNTYGRFQRPTHAYSGVIGKMVWSAINKMPLYIYGDGKNTRDYNYVDDVVDAIVLAVEQEAKNQRINLGTGIETSAIELSKLICKELDIVHKVNYMEERSIDIVKRRCLDNSKAKELLGWLPKTDLSSGISQTIKWQLGEI